MRESEALKDSILDAALDSIVSIDHESRVIEWNPAAKRTFGSTCEAVLGRDLADLIILPEYRERYRRGMAHYLATGEGPVLNRRIELESLQTGGPRSSWPSVRLRLPVADLRRPVDHRGLGIVALLHRG